MAQTFDLTVEHSLQGRHLFSPKLCFVAAGVALFGLWIGYYIADPFGFDEPGRDTWHHVAVLRELMAAPFAPSNPHIPTPEPSRYFTPVNILAALLGRLLGLTPYTLFGYMGAASSIGLVAGCWLFGRRYYASQWAPLILLLSLLFAWGLPLGHAGLHTYATMLSSAAYPSSIAFVLGIFSWALAIDTPDSDLKRRANLVLMAVLTAVILLTHQLSGAIAIVGTGSLILFNTDTSVRSKASLLISVAIGSLLVLAWPYFDVIDVIFSVSDARWKSVSTDINNLSILVVLAAPALVGILGFRRSKGGLRWEILFPAILLGSGFLVLELQGSAIANRLLPGLVLYAQLGLVWLILAYIERPDHSSAARIGVVTALLLFVAASAIGSGAGRLRDLDSRASEGSVIAMAEEIASYIPAGSVSFATESVVFPLQSTGRRVVSIPRPEPVAPSLVMRQAATDRFFHAGTSPSERRRLIERWGATYVVFAGSDLRPEVVRALRALGPARRFSHDAEVVKISIDTNSLSQGAGYVG